MLAFCFAVSGAQDMLSATSPARCREPAPLELQGASALRLSVSSGQRVGLTMNSLPQVTLHSVSRVPSLVLA
jgi:hypothetical protein